MARGRGGDRLRAGRDRPIRAFPVKLVRVFGSFVLTSVALPSSTRQQKQSMTEHLTANCILYFLGNILFSTFVHCDRGLETDWKTLVFVHAFFYPLYVGALWFADPTFK